MYCTLAAVLWFTIASASAGSYDLFSRGIDANNRGDSEIAISAFTGAITAGDLTPSYLPNAYLGRARAYLQTNLCVQARTDLDAAITLNPNYFDVYGLRADANKCVGRLDAALADVNTAMTMRPTAALYFLRARLHWDQGSFSQAAADAVRAADLDRKNGYYALWTGLAAIRTGRFDRTDLSRRASSFSPDAWPTPMLDFYRGAATADDVYRAATHVDAISAASRKCEADFYIGEWQLLGGNKAAARVLLNAALNECPRNFIVFGEARVELKRLD